MEVVVKMYSCNWETYKRHYKRVAKLAFAKDGIQIPDANIDYKLVEIPGNTIQQQRHGSTEHSRTMRIYLDGVVKYVVGLSNTNYDEDKKLEVETKGGKYIYGKPHYHANTYIPQGINKIFETYQRELEHNPKVKLYFYLLDTNQSYCSNLTSILNYRKLATIGFDVLNISDVSRDGWDSIGLNYKNNTSIVYTSFNKFLNDQAFVSSKNKGNYSAYVKYIEEEVEDENGNSMSKKTKYVYVVKGLGAEAYDCFLTMWTLIKLAGRENKKLEFLFAPEKYNFRLGQEHPRFTQSIPETITTLFNKLGITVEYETTDEVLQQFEREKCQYETAKKKKNIRNQEMFKNNLRAKGLQTKCCLCGCEVESILEAAHLWGVAEISKASSQKINNAINEDAMKGVVDEDSTYANDMFYKRYMLANSGDNGVWLCSNHHGMFDGHHFVFDSENGKMLVTTGNSIAKEYLQLTVINKGLEKKILTPQTKTFLKYAKIEENFKENESVWDSVIIPSHSNVKVYPVDEWEIPTAKAAEE